MWVVKASVSPIWGDLPSPKRFHAGLKSPLPCETEGLLRSEWWICSANPRFVLTLSFRISRLAVSPFDDPFIDRMAYD